jgi:3-oxoacyl-[acyl-carrier-protein] synthase II
MPSVRIVVTGLGAVTPVGNDVESFWNALLDGRSGVASRIAFAAGRGRPSYAAEVKGLTPEAAGLPRKKLKMMGRPAQLAFAAVREACTDAGLSVERNAPDPARLGIILGAGMLNADVAELGRAFHARSCGNPSEPFDAAVFGRVGGPELFPLWLLRHIPNLAAAHASVHFDARGPSNTIATGCVAGANAIGEAAALIARGEADVIVAGGTDARVSPLGTLRYRDLGWLATREDVDPAEVSAPFDEEASGFVNGEGAAVVVLESLEHAQKRGARVRAELAGYGAANDAGDFMNPSPEGGGLSRAISRCITVAGDQIDEIDCVFAPAPSVPAFDRAISDGLAAALNGHARNLAITATRSLLGHTHAASAAMDSVAAIQALEHGAVPPTLNVHRPITNFPLVTGAARYADFASALVAAYGFGGHAAALVWRRLPA